jgi:luciferase family oxidoreductase group 1
MTSFPLSVLDLAPVGRGSTPADALAASLHLAQATERLGFERFWVAEQFGMLEALHPGRIDLGLGRAPGTDGITAVALRRSRDISGEDFPRQVAELFAYFQGDWPDEHPFAKIHAVPAQGYQPAIWLLGSSDFGAVMAGQLGLPYSFAHHFAGDNTVAAINAYRQHFRPSATLERPYLMLGVNVLCAPTDEEADYLAGSGRLAILRLRQGRPDVYPTPEEAAEFSYTPMEREVIRGWTANHVVGSPATVRAGLEDLVARTGADELMLSTMAHDPKQRLRSYELVATEMGLGD